MKSEITQDGECREGGDAGRLLSLDTSPEVVEEGWCSKGSIRRVCVNQIEKMLVDIYFTVSFERKGGFLISVKSMDAVWTDWGEK